MAVGNLIFAVLTALVAVNFIFAEKNPPELGDFAYDHDGNENHGSPNEENDEEEKQERTFSLLFPSVFSTSCNFTRGSNYCLSCTQAVRCFSNNAGIGRNCRGLLRYCNGGRCSFFPGSECSSG